MASPDPLPTNDPPEPMREVLALLRCLENLPPPEDVFPFPAAPAHAADADESASGMAWIEDFDRILKAPISSVHLPAKPVSPFAMEREVMETLLDDLLEQEKMRERQCSSLSVPEQRTAQKETIFELDVGAQPLAEPDLGELVQTEEPDLFSGFHPSAEVGGTNGASPCIGRPDALLEGTEDKSPDSVEIDELRDLARQWNPDRPQPTKAPSGPALPELPSEGPEWPALPASPNQEWEEPEPTLTTSGFLSQLLTDATRGASSLEEPADLIEDCPAEVGAGNPYFVFTLAGADYAVALANVLEIGMPLPVAALPRVPDWLLGVSNVRGDIVSIVDLRLFFGLAAKGPRRRPRLLIVNSARNNLTIGLLVDGARAICRFTDDRVAEVTTPLGGFGGGPPNPPGEASIQPYLIGQVEHARRQLRILDLERLLQAPQMHQLS
jgi:purine-binding chemotaxis protein CheW